MEGNGKRKRGRPFKTRTLAEDGKVPKKARRISQRLADTREAAQEVESLQEEARQHWNEGQNEPTSNDAIHVEANVVIEEPGTADDRILSSPHPDLPAQRLSEEEGDERAPFSSGSSRRRDAERTPDRHQSTRKGIRGGERGDDAFESRAEIVREIEDGRERLREESRRIRNLEQLLNAASPERLQSPPNSRSRSRSIESRNSRERERSRSRINDRVHRHVEIDPRNVEHRRFSGNPPRENARNTCAPAINTNSGRIVNRLAANALPKFNGDPTRWMYFKRAYELSSDLGGYTDHENVARLHEALVGAAMETVESLMISDCTASEVMKLLALRFGNPDVICERIATDLKKLSNIDSNGMDLVAFATKLKSGVAAMQALNQPGYLHSPDLARDILSKIPAALKYDFNRFVGEKNSSEPRLVILADFLYRQAELSCRAGTNIIPVQKPRNHTRATCAAITQARSDSDCANNERRPDKSSLCGYCLRTNHRTTDCSELAGLLIPERWRWARHADRCYACLSGTHRLTTCRDKRRCAIGGCGSFHHPLLHSSVVVASDHGSTNRGGARGGAGRGSYVRFKQSKCQNPSQRAVRSGGETEQRVSKNGTVSTS